MQAVAQASIECEAFNAGYECFSLDTTTTSFVASSIELHIEAVAAAAVAECSCDKRSVSTWAAGYASSRTYIRLEASATASVDLEVCVEGAQPALALLHTRPAAFAIAHATRCPD